MMVVALKKLMKEKTNHQPPNPKESIRFSTVIYPDIVEKEENLGTQNPETSAQARSIHRSGGRRSCSLHGLRVRLNSSGISATCSHEVR
jgi:hypothetical protein